MVEQLSLSLHVFVLLSTESFVRCFVLLAAEILVACSKTNHKLAMEFLINLLAIDLSSFFFLFADSLLRYIFDK